MLKQKLFSNMFLRNMLADFGNRSAYSHLPGSFIPYFKYKIGTYQPDHFLYFPKEPYTLRYQNEIFNKLCEYKGYDIITYLEFHYSAYKEKQNFLRFLKYEISDRLKRKPKETYRQKLQSALDWVMEQQQELQQSQQEDLKQEIAQGVKDIFSRNPALNNHNSIEAAAHSLVEYINPRIERIIASTEERIENLTGSLPAGDIQLNNHNHQEKLIQLFYLVQTIHAPARVAKGEQLFKKFTNHDLASILHLHFDVFADKKLNTVEKNIKDCRDTLRINNPKVQKLTEALQEFFY